MTTKSAEKLPSFVLIIIASSVLSNACTVFPVSTAIQ